MSDHATPGVGGAAAKSADLLDFEVDKTYDSLIEAGKSLNSAFLIYFLLVSVTALLTFGLGAEETVEAPLLGFKVGRSYAAALSLVLSCFILYWIYSTALTHGLLTYKLLILLEERYKARPASIWHVAHPSFFWTSLTFLFAIKSEATKWLISAACLGFLASNHLIAGWLAWRVRGVLHFEGWRLWGWVGVIFLLLLPTAFMQGRFLWAMLGKGKMREMVRRLDYSEGPTGQE